MGWFLVSIALPLLAPLLVLLILKPLPLPLPVKQMLNFMTPLKDGQLCWGAICFSASALYDIAIYDPANAILPSSVVAYLNGALVVIIAGASSIAAIGAIFPTAVLRPEGVAWAKHFSCFLVSAFMTTCAAAIFITVHFGL